MSVQKMLQRTQSEAQRLYWRFFEKQESLYEDIFDEEEVPTELNWEVPGTEES